MNKVWVVLGMLGACTQPGDFEAYTFEDSPAVDAAVKPIGRPKPGKDGGKSPGGVPDAGGPESPVDAAPATHGLSGVWTVDREAAPIPCGAAPFTHLSRGTYADTWVITEQGGAVSIQVIASEWPIERYAGTWDGETLKISGEGAGAVDNVFQSVTSDFVLTMHGEELGGTESSTANDCKQPREVMGAITEL
jgi:hypothetical protein